MTVLAVTIVLYLEPYRSRIAEMHLGLVDGWYVLIQGILIVALLPLLVLDLKKLRGFPRFDRAIWIKYPPTWIFALFDVAIHALLLEFGTEHSSGRLSLWVALGTCGLLLALGIVAMFLIWLGRSTESNDDQSPDEWIDRESPISDPSLDRFGGKVVAERLANLLGQSKPPSICLIGRYGIGKTSILKMAERSLLSGENPHNVVTSWTSAWELKPDNVDFQILDNLLDDLSQRVDCMSINGIPTAYREAISATGDSWSKLIAKLSGSGPDARKVLDTLDNLLEICDLRVVLFIEDIDRSVQKHNDMRALYAFLDRVKELSNVTFVLSLGLQDDSSKPLIRVCEHTEQIARLPIPLVKNELQRVREECLAESLDDIDPVGRTERDERFGVARTGFMGDFLGLMYPLAIDYCAELIKDPRTLKLTLRRIRSVWISLHGEVDLDELIAVTVLRAAAPEAFEFLLTGYPQLRVNKKRDNFGEDRHEHLFDRLDERWKSVVANANWDSIAVRKLVDFLFPTWSGEPLADKFAMQAVSVGEGTDYWIRMTSEALDPEEIRDQSILQLLHSDEGKVELSDFRRECIAKRMLESETVSEKIEQFHRKVPESEIRPIASKLFSHILNGKGVRPSSKDSLKDGNFPGFIELWRMSHGRWEPEHEAWLLKEIRLALSLDLRFASDLFYYWHHESKSSVSDKIGNPTLYRDMIEHAKKIWEANPPIFIRVLPDDYAWSLRHFVVLYSQDGSGSTGFNPAEWKWLTPLLESGVRIDMDKLSAQILCLLIAEKAADADGSIELSTFGSRYKIDPAMGEALFGEKFRSLIAEVVKVKDFERYGRDAADLRSLRMQFEQWLRIGSRSE